MVKFIVPLKDILGRAYSQYELSSSNYNPNVNSTITITCTCKNVLGNPVSNKTLELFQNGTSNNAVANSAVVGGLNDKIEASDISFGFDADTKEIYIEVN